MAFRDVKRSIQDSIYRWWLAGLDLVYPLRCVGCGIPGEGWCSDCETSLARIVPPLCMQCGSQRRRRSGRCPRCIDFPSGLRLRAYARYRGSLLRALLHLKYRPNRGVADHMAGWLAELIRRESWQASSIIPVPLGRVRMRERGYNQAKLIAEGLADRIELPISDDILIRVKDTRSQVGLDPLARRRNVENAFQARPFSQAAKSVFLIDDLVTTGSTLLACASALMEAGVKKVYGLAVARA